MVLIEFSPPFQWKPSLRSHGVTRRFMWGWLAVARVPFGYSEFVERLGVAAIDLTKEEPEFETRLRTVVDAR